MLNTTHLLWKWKTMKVLFQVGYFLYRVLADDDNDRVNRNGMSLFRSGVLIGKRLTEAEIISHLREEKPVKFQVLSKDELEKCSPLYYCSNKYY